MPAATRTRPARPANAKATTDHLPKVEKAKPVDQSGPIEITAEPQNQIQVKLVGVDYLVTPPKAALAIKMATQARNAARDPEKGLEAMWEWLRIAFGDEESQHVQARLDDPSDLLDIEHVAKLMEAVIERSVDLPST